jgi:hypothetical protein
VVASSLPFLASLGSAATSAWKARLDPRFNGPRARLLVMVLLYLGPLMRSFERYLWRMRGGRDVERVNAEIPAPAQRPKISLLRGEFVVSYWNETGREKEHFLHELAAFFVPRKYRVSVGSGWNEWDLEIARGIWTSARIEVAVEDHVGPKRVVRVRTNLRTAKIGLWALVACLGVAALGVLLGIPEFTRMGLLLAGLDALSLGVQSFRLGRVLSRAYGLIAARLDMIPLNHRAEADAKAAA